MGTEQTAIIEFPITKGQNEGTERSVLPVGEFSALQNARFRKNNLLGKRNGYTSKSSIDAGGDPLGNGAGRLACLGPNFCVVDDRFCVRDTVSDSWAVPPFPDSVSTRLFGRFPEFMPAPALDPLQATSDVGLGGITGTLRPSFGSMTYAQGRVWACCSYYSTRVAGWMIRVVAVDPNETKVVFSQEIGPTSTDAAVRQYPVLLSTGAGTVVLIYDHVTAGAKDGVRVVTCTSVAAGFGPEVPFACLNSAANYCPSSSTEILFAYATAAAQYTVARMDPTTMTPSTTTTTAVAGGVAPTRLSVFGLASGLTWVGYTIPSGPNVGLYTAAFNASLVIQGTSLSWTSAFASATGPMVFAELSSTTVCAITKTIVATAYNAESLLVRTVSSTATFVGSPMIQMSCEALSQPFRVDGRVFIWVRHMAGSQLGVATLVRVPAESEYTSSPVSPYTRAFPIEATVDNRDVDAPVPGDASGPAVSLPLSTPMGYVALLDFTRDTVVIPTGTLLVRSFLLVPVRHRSEGLRYSPSCVVPCDGKLFVASAQPMWVDARGAEEAGFIQAPYAGALTVGGTPGSLTAGSAYSYACYFESVDSVGNVHRSGPSLPLSVDAATMGVATSLTVSFGTLQLSEHAQVRAKLFRTSANGSVFYLLATVDATPASSVAPATPSFTFVDTVADSFIERNPTIYTQIGQEQPASNFPACTFANVGGNRLWVGGGFSGGIVQASKQFTPHVAPEFVDDDAWRVSLPSNCTGMAWLDRQVLFTQDRIYVVNGDGPDAAGEGYFIAEPLPFNVGCIDWRSVAVCDLGVFFQSPRGLYLLPRGFAQPVAMDQVLDTLTTYPVITAARGEFNSQGGADTSEQVVQWCAVADEEATSGVVITFDAAFKAFYVDTCAADYPATFLSGWSGDAVQSPQLVTVGPNGASCWHPFRVQDGSYDDEGLAISMLAETGDVRPWGAFGYGVIHRSGVLGVLRSACTLNVLKTTDQGSRTTSRVFTGIAPDPVAGANFYLAAEQGSTEKKDVTTLRLRLTESSTSEGVSLIAMVIETGEQRQNFKRLGAADRIG